MIPQARRQRRLVSAAITFLGPGIFLAIGIHAWELNLVFTSDAQHVTGIVDTLRIIPGHRSSACVATYHYLTSTGTIRIKDQQLSAQTWNHLSPGRPVPVKYLSTQNGVSRIDLPSEDTYCRNEVRNSLLAALLLFGFGFLSFWSNRRGG